MRAYAWLALSDPLREQESSDGARGLYLGDSSSSRCLAYAFTCGRDVHGAFAVTGAAAILLIKGVT